MSNRLARGFYHHDVSLSGAEQLLRDASVSNSFLVRPSRTKPDAYVLSVRRTNGEITHMRIQRTNEGFDLGENQECFPTLYDLIDHYRRNIGELRDKNNDIIELTSPILSQMPTFKRYYHGSLTHSQVMSIFNKYDEIGSFLVRDSETMPGDFVLCVKTPEQISNIKIKNSKGSWFLGGRGRDEQIDRFYSLDGLVNFYIKHNKLVAENGAAFCLAQPCEFTWFYARDIPQRCEYLSKLIPSHNGQKTGFSLEFESLNQQAESQLSTFHKRNGEKPENRKRNRFRNILPYDETRVVLKNYSSTDYMNANRIRTPPDSLGREYIATQGPLPATVNDFWHMIQQEMVKCIVMITRETEGFKNKCAHYWPDLHTSQQYGSVTVENMNEINYGPTQASHNAPRTVRIMPSSSLSSSGLTQQFLKDEDYGYRVRTLRITTEDRRSWNIIHWQYLAWGDHDSPLTSNNGDKIQLILLLDFFERISQVFPIGPDMDSAPMVVHCSAGIGRSGATIAIDSILNRIRIYGLSTEIDIPDVIKYIRWHRSGLVQTERQYELIYRMIELFVEKFQHLRDSSSKQ